MINLEVETEFKKRNNHILKHNDTNANKELEEDQGYIDENGVFHGLDQDEKLFKENERLLTRLTNVANKEGFKNPDVSGTVSNSNIAHDMTSNTEHIVDIQGSQEKNA